jgi:hypothetical protein
MVLHQLVEPYAPVVPDGADDQYGPFFRKPVHDAFERTQADTVTFFVHS